MTPKEIFEHIKEYSLRTSTHPDDVAKVHAGMMQIERVMMDWAVSKREQEAQ